MKAGQWNIFSGGNAGHAGRIGPWLAAWMLLVGAGPCLRSIGKLVQRYYAVPPAMFAYTEASTRYVDCHGRLLRMELGPGEQWQVPIALEQVSPWVVASVVAVEDKRFWSHGGVDVVAVGRAALGNLTAGRIVSGASTISMQLARLLYPEKRGWGAKLRQTLRALSIERQLGKSAILEQYLNRAPMGGNIVGIEAAARIYFGKSAAGLSLAESSLLAGLPQRPAALRPDRHKKRALRRRRIVLARLREQGAITAEREHRVAGQFVAIRRTGSGMPRREPLYCAAASRGGIAPGSVVSTRLDPWWQDAVRTALHATVDHLPGVEDGAAVIIENTDGAVRAMVGTLDIDDPTAGWVNAATCPRSPGSTLKPFIYATGIDAGRIVPQTRLLDAPLTQSDYRPKNFDGRYRGYVTAREALACSLNTPVVRLLDTLGYAYVYNKMLASGLRGLAARKVEDLRLSLALGSGEVTLLELTAAYAGLARGGRLVAPRFRQRLDRVPVAADRVFSVGAVSLVTKMLSTYELPGAPGIPLAWKTGTSNGQKDAWCLAYNRDITIGVWIGNKTGRASPDLVGIRAAVPVVAAILAEAYGRDPPPLPETPGIRRVSLCAVTGLAAGPHCRRTVSGWAPEGIPLRLCCRCRRMQDSSAAMHAPVSLEPPAMESPRPGTYRAASGTLHLPLIAAGNEALMWFVDGRYLGCAARHNRVEFSVGKHDVVCVRENTGESRRIEFTVR